jgi:hypothetical protein
MRCELEMGALGLDVVLTSFGMKTACRYAHE